MNKERSDKSPWRSRYGGGWISDAQFLAESMVARKARHEKRGLPLAFWEIPKWEKQFLFQVTCASRLLKQYSASLIIRALNRPEAKNIYSLGAKFLLPILEEQSQLEAKKPPPPPPVALPAEEPKKLPTGARPAFTKKKSSLSKLRSLDADSH